MCRPSSRITDAWIGYVTRPNVTPYSERHERIRYFTWRQSSELNLHYSRILSKTGTFGGYISRDRRLKRRTGGSHNQRCRSTRCSSAYVTMMIDAITGKRLRHISIFSLNKSERWTSFDVVY